MESWIYRKLHFIVTIYNHETSLFHRWYENSGLRSGALKLRKMIGSTNRTIPITITIVTPVTTMVFNVGLICEWKPFSKDQLLNALSHSRKPLKKPFPVHNLWVIVCAFSVMLSKDHWPHPESFHNSSVYPYINL